MLRLNQSLVTPRLDDRLSKRIWDRSMLLITILVAVISGISVWLAWTMPDSAPPFSLIAFAPVLAVATISYSLRNIRFFYFLSHSGIRISLPSTVIVQAIGFALSVTPGHVGEIFKLHLIRERAETPVAQSAPLLLLERLTEGGSFLILAIVSAWMLPPVATRIPTPMLTLLGLGVMFIFALTRHRWHNLIAVIHPRFAELRLWQRVFPHLQNLWYGLETSFTPMQILVGLALSVLARFADGWVVLITAHMMGVPLTIPVAVFVLAVSGLAGGVSILPAGIGAVETTMVGLLTLFGVPWSNALAITLLARLSILWFWVALGLGLAFWLHFPPLRLRSRKDRET